LQAFPSLHVCLNSGSHFDPELQNAVNMVCFQEGCTEDCYETSMKQLGPVVILIQAFAADILE